MQPAQSDSSLKRGCRSSLWNLLNLSDNLNGRACLKKQASFSKRNTFNIKTWVSLLVRNTSKNVHFFTEVKSYCSKSWQQKIRLNLNYWGKRTFLPEIIVKNVQPPTTEVKTSESNLDRMKYSSRTDIYKWGTNKRSTHLASRKCQSKCTTTLIITEVKTWEATWQQEILYNYL